MNNNILVSAPLALSLGGFLSSLIISFVRPWSLVGVPYVFWCSFHWAHKDLTLASRLLPTHSPDARYSQKMLPRTSWAKPRSRACKTSMQMCSKPSPGRSKIGHHVPKLLASVPQGPPCCMWSNFFVVSSSLLISIYHFS